MSGDADTTSRRSLALQYADDRNLAARQSIYRFRQSRRNVHDWAIGLASPRGAEAVLDVGCGNGLYLAELARRSHSGLTVGLDLSRGMLHSARERAASDALLMAGDSQRLPFADATFDLTLAMHMLYHVPDRALAISELRRVTRPGGIALALTNSSAHLAELTALFAESAHAVGAVEEHVEFRSHFLFSSESGGSELGASFEEVVRHDIESELVITEVEPVVDYLRSMRSALSADARHPILGEVRRRAGAIIDRDDAFRVRTSVGCFVCR